MTASFLACKCSLTFDFVFMTKEQLTCATFSLFTLSPIVQHPYIHVSSFSFSGFKRNK